MGGRRPMCSQAAPRRPTACLPGCPRHHAIAGAAGRAWPGLAGLGPRLPASLRADCGPPNPPGGDPQRARCCEGGPRSRSGLGCAGRPQTAKSGVCEAQSASCRKTQSGEDALARERDGGLTWGQAASSVCGKSRFGCCAAPNSCRMLAARSCAVPTAPNALPAGTGRPQGSLLAPHTERRLLRPPGSLLEAANPPARQPHHEDPLRVAAGSQEQAHARSKTCRPLPWRPTRAQSCRTAAFPEVRCRRRHARGATSKR